MIYLFNQTEELIDVIDEASLAEFTHTIELNQFDRASFEVPVDYKPEIIKEAQFFGFQSRDRAFCLFRISEKSYDLGLTIQGIDRAESDLHSVIIENKRPSGTADQVLRGILEGTGYQLGDTNRLTVNGKMSFYYISVRQALVKIIESYGCEFRVRYTFVENKIIGRYIDLYQRFGRKTGHQFEYGSNILNITYEESSDEVVTALIGRGKGEQSTDETGEATVGYGRRIQFKDVVWSVSKGDPVDKPAGQNYVANETARNIYGLHQNGVIKHRFGVYTNEDIEDPIELLKATYKELQRLSVPIVTFKANLLDLANAIEQDIWIGDSVGIVRDQIGIAFEARIHKLTIDKLDDNRSVAELGDYQTLQAKDRTTRQQAIIDAVSGFSESLIEEAIANEVERRDKEFDEKMRINKLEFDNALESVKAKAEEDKQKLSDTIDQRFSGFDNGPLQEIKRKAIEALQNAGASTLLAQEAKRIGLDSITKLEEFKRQTFNTQSALSGAIDALKRTVTNDIRPKQAQVEAEIAKQVEALVQTKKELAGVKSAQATYEETTTRRLSELTNLANGKASKSELTQTAEELASKIASVKVGGRNLLRGSKGPFLPDRKPANFDNAILYVGQTSIYMEQGQEYIISAKTDGTFTAHHDGNKESDNVVLWIMDKDVRNYQIVSDLKTGTTGTKITWNKPTGIYHLRVNAYHKEATKSVWDVKIEKGNVATDWSPALEDIEGQISTVESNFRQRADSLDAGVSRLTEGLRTKADISSLNVTAENIRQSVKSLETNTQNKLDQKLSTVEFEVRAGSIRQEILNATKDKADKTLVLSEAGKIREEFSKMKVGGRNLIRNYDWNGLLPLSSNQAGWKFERVEDQFAKSGYTLKATCTKGGNGGFYKTLFDLSSDEFQGKDMTWSWDMKSSRPITFYDIGFEAGGLKKNVPVSTEWERISNTFQVAFKQFYSCVFYANGWQVGDVVYIRDPQLEEGTIATTPRPAPEDGKTDLIVAKSEFQKTAEGLRTDMSAIQEYVNKDGQRQEVLRRYTREESAKQATAVRDLVARDYVGKATYQEDVKGLERRFSAISTQTNNDIATKIAQYKQTVDGQFANITSQIAGKANQTDFQRVKETSQLYERILGNTDNGIADNVARMAVTNQIFQVEVGKYGGGGPNLVKNSDFKDGMNEWTSKQNLGILVKHGFYHNGQKNLMRLSNSTQSDIFLNSPRFELERNTDYVLNFRGFNNGALVSYDVFILGRKAGETSDFSIAKKVVDAQKLSTSRCEDVSITFNSGEMDNAFIRFDNNGVQSGTADLYITEVDLYKGYKPRPWQPHPEDIVTDANAKLETIRTQMTLLQGSWAVQNLTNAGSIVSQINATNNQILIEAEKIRLKGKTLLDELTAIQGYFKRLFVGEGTFATLNADVIRTNSITADKLVVNEALANRLVSNEIITSKLVASRAFVNALKAVTIDASQIVTGTLRGDRIYGGTIRGTDIYGATLTGHTKIQLGTYGSFDTVDGGLQINVPRTANSKDGLGVQFIGSYGRGENVPYGLFIYKDSDLTTDSTVLQSDEFLMTVEGYIKAKGIGWFKTGTGNVGGKLTATIGLWNSNNVYLSFGGSGNDIYYSYNGSAYSLWEVVNQHFSDRRLKENIVNCEHKALDYIQQFQFKEYDWKKQEDRPQKAHTKIGLIAQEVQAVDPTLVYENGGILNLDNLRLTNIALKAIQELSQRIETLERKLA